MQIYDNNAVFVVPFKWYFTNCYTVISHLGIQKNMDTYTKAYLLFGLSEDVKLIKAYFNNTFPF